MTVRDTRLCFIGDSFVAGFGDPEHRGWVGRVCGRSDQAGRPITAYNLGIRLNTSSDVRSRWKREAEQRLPTGCDGRIVLSFGVNDTTAVGTETRVGTSTSLKNLKAILDGAARASWPVFVVGPVPIADSAQNTRSAALGRRLAVACREREAPFVDVLGQLESDEVWMRDVRGGDGAHPATGGYERLADIVFEPWWKWLSAD